MAEDKEAKEEEELSLAPPPEEKKQAAGAPPWMATFADMVTLLLCFFILLFAMSTIQKDTYKELVKSLRIAFGARHVPEAGTREGLIMREIPPEAAETPPSEDIGAKIEKELEEIASEIRELVQFNQLGGEVSVTQSEEGIIITMSDLLLFSKGETTLSEKGLDILRKVSVVLSKLAYHVKIKGHTDSFPIASAQYPSNWELSTARASQVVRLLVENGVSPRHISAEGYAHYHPVASNDTERGRALNRRVEIVYERDSLARKFAELKAMQDQQP